MPRGQLAFITETFEVLMKKNSGAETDDDDDDGGGYVD